MKLVKHFVLALLLVSAISAKASAGEMPTPPSTEDPPRAIAVDEGTSTISDPCTDQAGIISAETSDYLIYEAWAALLSVY